MPPSLSITNILQALYEESPTIKMYVDGVAEGKPFPWTLIIKSSEHEQNEKIVERARDILHDAEKCNDTEMASIMLELLDEAMILEEEDYDITMFKDDAIVEGSRQTVKAEKVEALKNYARFKGYEISIKKHDTL